MSWTEESFHRWFCARPHVHEASDTFCIRDEYIIRDLFLFPHWNTGRWRKFKVANGQSRTCVRLTRRWAAKTSPTEGNRVGGHVNVNEQARNIFSFQVFKKCRHLFPGPCGLWKKIVDARPFPFDFFFSFCPVTRSPFHFLLNQKSLP